MAYANSAISDIIATTIESRTRKAADNLTANNALLNRLKTRGNVKTISGGSQILQELFYDDPSTNYAASYSGYETISISPDSPISAAAFNLKHYADAVTISGPEILQNSGKEQMIDLLATRVEIAEARLMNKIDTDLYATETGNGGKNLSGLVDLLPTTTVTSGQVPQRVATSTYGGINRASWSFWRPLYQTGLGVNGAATALSSTTVQKALNQVSLGLIRGNDKVDLILAGTKAYGIFLESLQAIQRITSEGDSGSAGFAQLKYYGTGGATDVVLADGIGGHLTNTFTPATFLLLNTKHLFFRPHANRNFVPIGGDRQSVNQDAVVRLFGWSGALTSDGNQFHGRIDGDVTA